MNKTILYLSAVAMLLVGACAKSEIESVSASDGGADVPEVGQGVSPVEVTSAKFISGKAIVKFSEEMTLAIEKGTATKAVAGISEAIGLSGMERVFPDAGEFEERTRREGLHRFYYVDFDKSVPYEVAEEALSSLDGVVSVEPCRAVKSLAFNDPYMSQMWGLKGNYDINIQEAWDYTTGDPNVIVCVVDQGIQLDHPDLSWNCGSDNYNFVYSNTTIHPGDHGTHVSGTIAAVSNNGVGVAGIAGGDYKAGKRGITLQSAQVFDGNYSARSFGAAIKWGADHGAVISQNSWGYNFDYNDDGKLSGSELTDALAAEASSSDKEAMDYFTKYAGCDKNGEQREDSPMKGGIVCFAAGNDGIANGAPANYETCVAVGAVQSSGSVASFSNYGDWVDICAPGQVIYSTLTSSKYGQLSGTSMACPHVSGAAAIIVSLFGGPGFTNEMLREILINGANPNLINYKSHPTGPYLDVKGSIDYGIGKFKRENNQNPEIVTDYTGDFVFRQYQSISIPFRITDPDGDGVTVEGEFEGRGSLVRDDEDPTIWNFTLLCELVSDFTAKKGKIVAKDLYGGETVYEFTYRVIKNNAPEVIGTIDDVIIVGVGSDATVSFDPSKIFRDEDGEDLTLAIKTSQAANGTVSLDGNKIRIKTTSYGTSTVSLSASDALKEKATVKFSFLVRPTETPMDYYPNPVKDKLYVRTGVTLEPTTIVIETPTGNALYDETVECSAFQPAVVDMSGYAPGSYTLRVTVAGITYVNTIVKR